LSEAASWALRADMVWADATVLLLLLLLLSFPDA
jgi:hypothetical protein